jgi:hypothetical protein
MSWACSRWERSQIPLVGPAFTLRFIPAREDLDSYTSKTTACIVALLKNAPRTPRS